MIFLCKGEGAALGLGGLEIGGDLELGEGRGLGIDSVGRVQLRWVVGWGGWDLGATEGTGVGTCSFLTGAAVFKMLEG